MHEQLKRLQWAANEVLASEKVRGPNASYPPAFCLVSAGSLGRLERALTGEDEPQGNGLRHDFVSFDEACGECGFPCNGHPLHATHEGAACSPLCPAMLSDSTVLHGTFTIGDHVLKVFNANFAMPDNVVLINGNPVHLDCRTPPPDAPKPMCQCDDCRTPPPDTCESNLAICRRDRDAARDERDELRKENKALKQERNCLRRKLAECQYRHETRADPVITEVAPDLKWYPAFRDAAYKAADLWKRGWGNYHFFVDAMANLCSLAEQGEVVASVGVDLAKEGGDKTKAAVYWSPVLVEREISTLKREIEQLQGECQAFRSETIAAENESDKLKDQLAATKEVIGAAQEWAGGWGNPQCHGPSYHKLASKLRAAVNAYDAACPVNGTPTN